jgi:hypothetical protein
MPPLPPTSEAVKTTTTSLQPQYQTVSTSATTMMELYLDSLSDDQLQVEIGTMEAFVGMLKAEVERRQPAAGTTYLHTFTAAGPDTLPPPVIGITEQRTPSSQHTLREGRGPASTIGSLVDEHSTSGNDQRCEFYVPPRFLGSNRNRCQRRATTHTTPTTLNSGT